MPKTSQVTQVPTTTKAPKKTSIASKLDEVLNTESGQRYLQMVEMTGTTTKQKLYQDVVATTEFLSSYHRWVEAGEALPKMPETPQESQVKIPNTFVRLIHKNQEYLVIKNKGGTEEGVTYKNTYAKETHPVTGEPLPMDLKTGREPTYFIPFDPVELQTRYDRADDLLAVGESYGCILVTNSRNYLIAPEHFLRPRQDLLTDIATNKPIFG